MVFSNIINNSLLLQRKIWLQSL